MARPDDLIAAQRERVAEAARTLELETSKLHGMEEMARAMGSPVKRSPAGEGTSSGKVGGRQPGSITKTWRRVLGSLLMREGDWFSAHDVTDVVRNLERREIRPSEVRRIFKTYEANGYVEQNDRGQFRITDEAVAKFGLGNEPQQDPAIADENEEEDGEVAAEPSDESGPDVPASEPLNLVNPFSRVGMKGG
jgi:hypothetical protein